MSTVLAINEELNGNKEKKTSEYCLLIYFSNKHTDGMQ